MAYIGTKPTIGNFQICDAISVVNNQAAYTMQVGSVNVIPQSANHMIVSLNGTIQKPNSSFTVSGSTITFDSNLATGDVIDFIQILGDVLDLGVPSDATVTTAKLADSSVSLAKLTATGTKDATTFLRGDNTFAVPPLGGITEADMFRLTADTANGTNGDIISSGITVDSNLNFGSFFGTNDNSTVYFEFYDHNENLLKVSKANTSNFHSSVIKALKFMTDFKYKFDPNLVGVNKPFNNNKIDTSLSENKKEDSVEDAIKRLREVKSLLEEGLITQEEFDKISSRLKAIILN